MKPEIKILVEVSKTEIRKIEYTSRKGTPAVLYFQKAWVHVGDDNPYPIEVRRPDPTQFLPKGRYFITALAEGQRGPVLDYDNMVPAQAAAARTA